MADAAASQQQQEKPTPLSIAGRHVESVIFVIATIVFQLIILVLFLIFVDFSKSFSDGETNNTSNHVVQFYKTFSDVNGMIFLGFGFLMTFLRKYSYSAVAINFFISCLCIQWAVLCLGFFEQATHGFSGKISLSLQGLIDAEFAAAAVLISFGGIIGKVSPTQLLIMGFFEIIFYSINYYICFKLLFLNDIGGSMTIHVLGAYFGLVVTWIISPAAAKGDDTEKKASYNSDLFSIIGTIFLWMYWPSFNGAMSPGNAQHRAILNTFCAQAASCVIVFAISRLVRHDGKWEMEDIQNATVAGGVAIGSSADIITGPGGSIAIGIIAGTVSCLGFRFLSPILNKYLKLNDSCGIHNLHAMPGIIGGLSSIIAAGIGSSYGLAYGVSYFNMFHWKTAQAGIQAAGLVISLAFAIFGGIFTAMLMLGFQCIFKNVKFFEDSEYWHVGSGYNSIFDDGNKDKELEDKKV